MPLKTPIAFLIFNRPETTEKVFAEIAKARPEKLLVVADGPRPAKAGEAERCEQARRIISSVDWDCEVLTNFSDVNLGCKKRVASGLDWVFDTVEEAIVLEDDCLPSQSFFRFCEELLARYRDDTRVMQICGANFLNGWKRDEHSYYFSNYGPIWGWASWRRAWRLYDVEMKLWPELKKKRILQDFCVNQDEVKAREGIYDDVFSGKIDTWDYQWGFAKLVNSGLSITPNVNLISNIGFGANATHTSSADNAFAGMQANEVAFPLTHPPCILRDRASDEKYVNDFMLRKPQRGLKSILKGLTGSL